MRFKRLLSSALAASLLAGLLTVAAPAASASQLSAFADLTDPKVAECAEFLRLLKVVNGVPGGSYNPGGTLSRAEFCKMAVVALDRDDEENAQRGRTIYLDVGPTHWARGYINLASTITLGASSTGKGGTVLVSGIGDGTFQPDRPITYGEAVTILCRVLGYGVNDVSSGGAWYDGYLAAGKQAGLTEDLTLSGTDVITRDQAAILFYNLFFANPKGSSETYLETRGGKSQEGHIILDTDATADDGTTGAVKTTKGIYKSNRTFDPTLEGKEGKVILDEDDKLLAFQIKAGTLDKVVNLTSAEATYLMASGGDKLDVEPDTRVFKDGKDTTWAGVYKDLKSSTSLTFHYGSNGKLAYLYFPRDSEDGPAAMVARSTPNGTVNPFGSLADGATYAMYKNGIAATAADIRLYDVATYDAGTRVIQVSDGKLTGIYETAYPSPAAPITITVMGEEFQVLSCARSDLAAFKVGDRITLLLTGENKVAGVVSSDVIKATAVGVASVSGEGSDVTATVKLLQSGLEVSGKVSATAKDRCDNQLVTVTSGDIGKLSLTPIQGSAAKGKLDVTGRTLGEKAVAENVVVYDRVKNGAMVRVKYDQLPTTVAASSISFVSYDYAGRVQYIVLNDVTGDAYTYGYFSYTPVAEHTRTEYDYDADGNEIPGSGKEVSTGADPATLCVKLADSTGKETTSPKGTFIGTVKQGAIGGVAYAANGSIAATVTLSELKNVHRTDFDSEEMTVTVAGVSYPVAENVQCYNKTTKSWFAPGKAGMEDARAYSDSLNLYYDRSPAEGGKIRMIVVP